MIVNECVNCGKEAILHTPEQMRVCYIKLNDKLKQRPSLGFCGFCGTDISRHSIDQKMYCLIKLSEQVQEVRA